MSTLVILALRAAVLSSSLIAQQASTPQPANPGPPQIPDQRFVADMAGKNIADVLALYTADAVFLDPQGGRFATPDALKKLYEQVFASFDSDLLLEQKSITFAGPLGDPSSATETSAYSENLRTRATGDLRHLCGGVTIDWVRRDAGTAQDRWLMARMVWSATPCAAVPAPPRNTASGSRSTSSAWAQIPPQKPRDRRS